MAKTTTTIKAQAAQRATAKQARAGAATPASRNSQRRMKKKPTLEELTLRSFHLAYEQHHRENV
jgi:hypothetical protein